MNDRQFHILASITEPAALDWLAPSPRAGESEPPEPVKIVVCIVWAITATLIGAFAYGVLR